ncbi:MAG: SDR family NAD(P)-dependent oxidoreductase [Roseiarcus sp.]
MGEDTGGTERRVTLITGASGGIGADLARVFARRGHGLALVARSADKLAKLADEIEKLSGPRPLVIVADLTQPQAAQTVAAALEAEKASVEILVNNAGFGLSGHVAELDQAEQLAIVDLNVRSVVAMTLRFLPQIRAARGKILNVASIVAFFPGGPGMAIYYASKSFVLSFSLGLAQELRSDGVTVSALCPGMTPSGFQERAGFGLHVKLGMLPSTTTMEVAEEGYAGLMAGKREIVPGLFNKVGAAFLPLMPKSAVLMSVAQMQQKRF